MKLELISPEQLNLSKVIFVSTTLLRHLHSLFLHDLLLLLLGLSLQLTQSICPSLIFLLALTGKGNIVGESLHLEDVLPVVHALTDWNYLGIYCWKQISGSFLGIIIVEKTNIGEDTELFTPSFEPVLTDFVKVANHERL